MHKTLAESVVHRLGFEVASVGAETLERHPVAEYLRSFDAAGDVGPYWQVPAQAVAVCKSIEQSLGLKSVESYHRLVLLTLIGQYEERATARNYPSEIDAYYRTYLLGIVSQMARNPDGFYRHGNDRFAKDFAVCRHKLVPCGAQLVDVRSGIPRSTTVHVGARACLRFIGYMLGRVGGFRTLYEMHMDPRLVLEFSPEGWNRCYVRIARLLECHPDVLGVFGVSWWFDPALAGISPKLDFLRDIPQGGGAHLFAVSNGKTHVGNALANSRERKAAYEQGIYRPADWLMVWSRKDLIAWAARRDG